VSESPAAARPPGNPGRLAAAEPHWALILDCADAIMALLEADGPPDTDAERDAWQHRLLTVRSHLDAIWSLAQPEEE